MREASSSEEKAGLIGEPQDEGQRALELVESPRPDRVLALALPLWVETSVARPGGDGNVSGFAIAFGWNTPQRSSAYLISDEALVRPVWVAETDLISNSIREPS
jgi:hypothetical protein